MTRSSQSLRVSRGFLCRSLHIWTVRDDEQFCAASRLGASHHIARSGSLHSFCTCRSSSLRLFQSGNGAPYPSDPCRSETSSFLNGSPVTSVSNETLLRPCLKDHANESWNNFVTFNRPEVEMTSYGSERAFFLFCRESPLLGKMYSSSGRDSRIDCFQSHVYSLFSLSSIQRRMVTVMQALASVS
mmetsp:Transcript_1784/g.3255  ORF Transcript_1784/g.3255 Transcript_1784/m.3255 type:complete len:186 (-) Transcript_1784:1402-1959(-)